MTVPQPCFLRLFYDICSLSGRQVDYRKDTQKRAGRSIPDGSAPGGRAIRSALDKARVMKAEALGIDIRAVMPLYIYE